MKNGILVSLHCAPGASRSPTTYFGRARPRPFNSRVSAVAPFECHRITQSSCHCPAQAGIETDAGPGALALNTAELKAHPPTQEPRPIASKNQVPKNFSATARRLKELEEYAAINGHCNVPYTHPGGLGKWSAEQRHRWRRGLLSTHTFRALSALGFNFDSQTSRWATHFTQLAEFHSKQGHCNVSNKDPDAPTGLYTWILVQRQRKRQNRLEDDRARRLEGLGFVWEPVADRWERRFSELQQFVDMYGHARVPSGWPENPALAAWVNTVRSQYKGRDGDRNGLTLSQETRLRELGFDFGRHVSWDSRIRQLMGVKTQQGHLRGRRLPNIGAFEGLGDWVKRQRGYWRAGKLSLERTAQLEAIGLELDPENAAWERGLSLLDEELERNGFTTLFVSLKVLGGRPLLHAVHAGPEEVEGALPSESSSMALKEWFMRNERDATRERLRPDRAAALARRGFVVGGGRGLQDEG